MTDRTEPLSCCPSGNCGGIAAPRFHQDVDPGRQPRRPRSRHAGHGRPLRGLRTGKLVPADKKLDPQWVKSLFDRGTREVYRGKDLEKIGMPIGGLCAGQLYLGGDGKLWHWDIFNKAMGTGDHNYAHPPLPSSPLEQGFAVEIAAGGRKASAGLGPHGLLRHHLLRRVSRSPTSSIAIRSRPSAVSLEAFSPHIPLDTQASSLPATVMRYTVKNTSSGKVEVQLAGWLENAVGLYTAPGDAAERRNQVLRKPGLLAIHSEIGPEAAEKSDRADIVFEDFQKETYEGWTVTGEAFGKGPILKSDIPDYQGDVGTKGPRVVNSHASAPGSNVARARQPHRHAHQQAVHDRAAISSASGSAAAITRAKRASTCSWTARVVRTAAGHDNNQMRQEGFDVRKLQGKTARLGNRR